VYQLAPITADHIARARRVMDRYADLRIGLTDASVVVLAIEHKTVDLLCTDERHFRALRGPGGRPFRLRPADA
jgi:predicted nucleic acid-binding protein